MDHKRLKSENHWVSGVVVIVVLFSFALYVHQHRKGGCSSCGGGLPPGKHSSNIAPPHPAMFPLPIVSQHTTVSSIFTALTNGAR